MKQALVALAVSMALAGPNALAQTATSTVSANANGQLIITTIITPTTSSGATLSPTPPPPSIPIADSPPSTNYQGGWTSGFLTPISSTAKWTKVSGGLPHTNFGVDVNYEVTTSNNEPMTPIYQDGDWTNRSSGTTHLADLPLPPFVIPNPSGGDTPNNPLIIYNQDSKMVFGVNGTARPNAAGPLYGYIAAPAMNHGGSGLLGGETTSNELKAGINHALAINIWGQKYLNKSNGGFVKPALRADAGFASSGGADYYGSSLPIWMGSRLAIPASVTAQSLGITSTAGKNLLAALQKYGAIVVDNSAWDCLYINATSDAESDLYGIQGEIKKLMPVLQVVQ